MMRPEHCVSDIGKDMKFKLAKLNRTHILHSQPLKTGKINQNINYCFLIYYFCVILKVIKDALYCVGYFCNKLFSSLKR